MSQYSFPSKFRLKHRKSIHTLFESGKSFNNFPVKMIFAEESHTDGSGLKVGFSVPKKNFKKAVHRNLLKRRMKEAFRLNKDLIPLSGKSFSVFLIFTASEIISFQIIEKAVKNCLEQLKKHS